MCVRPPCSSAVVRAKPRSPKGPADALLPAVIESPAAAARPLRGAWQLVGRYGADVGAVWKKETRGKSAGGLQHVDRRQAYVASALILS